MHSCIAVLPFQNYYDALSTYLARTQSEFVSGLSSYLIDLFNL